MNMTDTLILDCKIHCLGGSHTFSLDKVWKNGPKEPPVRASAEFVEIVHTAL